MLDVSFVALEVSDINSYSCIGRFGQLRDVFQTKPVFRLRLAETGFVGGPVFVEVDRAVETMLDDCPTSGIAEITS